MSTAKRTTKSALKRVGWDKRAASLYTARTSQGRRGLKDDRQMAFFMTAVLECDANCIDIGANHGKILAEIVASAPEGHHMAVEAVPRLADDLRDRFPSVEIHSSALADETGETTFFVASASTGWSGMKPRGWLDTDYQEITVPVQRLDDLVTDERPVHFVKIDVEGAEVRVLQGAKELLSRDHPALWLEHGARSCAAHGTTSQDLWELLGRHNYRVWTADGEGPLDLPSFLAANDLPMWTYMAHR